MMIFGPLIALHIQKAHERYSKPEPSLSEIKKFLDDLTFDYPFLQYRAPITNQVKTATVHIMPSDGGSTKPSASMAITKVHIILNMEWAARLFYCRKCRIETATPEEIVNSVDCEDDLIFALGHEMAHVVCDRGNINPFREQYKKRFINWVNEVFADMFSWKFAMAQDVDATIAAMQRKQASMKQDVNTNSHPSYDLRMKYVQGRKFDAALIKEIYDDCEIDDENLLAAVLQLYGYGADNRSDMNII